ncbi:MAG: Gfo/Idh/MocA family oxidoreductase [Chthoniobacterales bacterium]|nr:Gfo/Idh/MocA family oxidoreductase [Chthoniobacterales bacterium]
MAKNTVKVGIVGIGGYGRALLELLLDEQQAGTAEISAAVVVDPAADASHLAFLKSGAPACRIYRSWEELMTAGEKLQLMVLPVGIPFHADLSVSSLAAGWNVLVEKPLAGSVADGLRIVEAEERSGRFVAVGYQDMYGEAVPEILSAISSGEIGAVERVSAFAIWGRPRSYYRRNTWAGRLYDAGRPVFDSPFNNALAHFLNMALVFAGDTRGNPARPLSAQAALFRRHAIESCDTASIRWATDSGAQVDVYFSHLTSRQIGPHLQIHGSRGSIFWRVEDCWELHSGGKPALRRGVQTGPELRKSMMRRVLQRASGEEVKVFTPRQALAHVEAVELAHRAAEIFTLPPGPVPAEEEWIEADHLEEVMRSARDANRLLCAQSLAEPLRHTCSE